MAKLALHRKKDDESIVVLEGIDPEVCEKLKGDYDDNVGTCTTLKKEVSPDQIELKHMPVERPVRRRRIE
ncbi:MAG: hypothetical protein JRD89_08005 [Deltaproteobacteria bacterium]|nr:hypothetical protein [Deltaproteobacteria bacterium]